MTRWQFKVMVQMSDGLRTFTKETDEDNLGDELMLLIKDAPIKIVSILVQPKAH